jgi:hypothetical protein
MRVLAASCCRRIRSMRSSITTRTLAVVAAGSSPRTSARLARGLGAIGWRSCRGSRCSSTSTARTTCAAPVVATRRWPYPCRGWHSSAGEARRRRAGESSVSSRRLYEAHHSPITGGQRTRGPRGYSNRGKPRVPCRAGGRLLWRWHRPGVATPDCSSHAPPAARDVCAASLAPGHPREGGASTGLLGCSVAADASRLEAALLHLDPRV